MTFTVVCHFWGGGWVPELAALGVGLLLFAVIVVAVPAEA